LAGVKLALSPVGLLLVAGLGAGGLGRGERRLLSSDELLLRR